MTQRAVKFRQNRAATLPASLPQTDEEAQLRDLVPLCTYANAVSLFPAKLPNLFNYQKSGSRPSVGKQKPRPDTQLGLEFCAAQLSLLISCSARRRSLGRPTGPNATNYATSRPIKRVGRRHDSRPDFAWLTMATTTNQTASPSSSLSLSTANNNPQSRAGHKSSASLQGQLQHPYSVQSSSAATEAARLPTASAASPVDAASSGGIALRNELRPPLPAGAKPPASHTMAMSAVVSPDPVAGPPPPPPRLSMTSKEWVIPPRPKPGRKPATDTPPTKRKAQNRAAQRAFRERRAARVGELEELLDQQRDVQDQEKDDLKARVHDLELEVQSFRSRCSLLESMFERERQDRIRAETKFEALNQRQQQPSSDGDGYGRQGPTRHDLRQNSTTQHHDNHLPTPNLHTPQVSHSHSGSSLPSAPHDASQSSLSIQDGGLPDDCAKCTFGPECKCLNDVAEALAKPTEVQASVPLSSPTSAGRKRRRSQTGAEDYEFGHAQNVPDADSTADSMGVKESCGFCNQSSHCVCAEGAQVPPHAMDPANALPPIVNQTQTPPPSEADVGTGPVPMEMTADGAVKLPSRTRTSKARPARTQDATRGCGPGGPGTCAQCQADPKSGLFCRLMAASISSDGDASASGCCGGKGADGSCCRGPAKKNITLPSLPSLGLSCADAYQTLSSHRNFERAADDISSWLPKLKTTPRDGGLPGLGQRIPMEVEAASIMSVLKDFDVRFGGP